MPTKKIYPPNDTVYQDWLGNFISVANGNSAICGLLAGDITLLQTDKANFYATITDTKN